MDTNVSILGWIHFFYFHKIIKKSVIMSFAEKIKMRKKIDIIKTTPQHVKIMHNDYKKNM